jgi:hypothetical protein
MLPDFKRVLARVQSDYAFYIGCQTNPAVALAGYDLTADERSALSDPIKLADILKRGVGSTSRLPSITVKISGSHDWVNRAVATDRGGADAYATEIASEVTAIRSAADDAERTEAAVRLMDLIG